jgi:DNA polymerase III delta prime subunit
MNWSEKYRPNNIDDLYLSYDSKTKIKQWINDFIKKKKNFTNCLLLHGPPGVGKTSLANIILETNDFDIIEFNSSDIRNQKTLKDKIENINGNINILDFMRNKKKHIGIIIDELDGINNTEKGALKELINIINNTKTYSSPFICTTNSINKKIDLLKKKALYIKISKPTKKIVREFINKICENESLKLSDTIKNLIADTSQLDFRRIIVLMEYLFSYNISNIADSDLETIIENYDKKNIDYTIYEGTDKILNGYYKDFSTIVENDSSNIGYIFYENFQNFIINNKKCSDKQKFETISKIYNSYSDGDKLDKKIYINQHFYLNNYNNYLKFNIPAFLMSNLEKTPYNKFNKLNYSTMINKISFEYLNIKLVHIINNLGLSNNYIYNCDYIYSCIKNNNKDLVPIIIKNDLDKIIIEKICKLSTFHKNDEASQLKKMVTKYFKLLL